MISEDASLAPFGEYDSPSSSTDDEIESGPVVEPLATGREKRATAGNRLSSLLNREGDDELELLFAEDQEEEEEDVEFEDEEVHASDAELDSSTDEEDGALMHEDDGLAGEKELQKQDRLERQKKRKAQEIFKKSRGPRKKVQIDPSTTPVKLGLRSKKRIERTSWAHADADPPTRVSSRKQTVQNREVVHQRLMESEQTRLKVMQQMDEAQKRKQAAKPKALTQADRMDEAVKTERRNAKSLNRWEESEKKRAEEQRAKLEALHSRQLTGPVITWWSGLARWVDGKVAQLGVKDIRGAGYIESSASKETQAARKSVEELSDEVSNAVDDLNVTMPKVLHPHHLMESSEHMTLPMGSRASMPQRINFAPPESPFGFLDGIHAYAAMPVQQQRAEFTGTADGDLRSHRFPDSGLPDQQGFNEPPSTTAKTLAPAIEFASRTLLALKEIDANAVKLPELQNSVLLKKSRARILKPASETCAITMQSAKFRDPKTGLAYANSYAFKEIQRLRTGGARWSNLLDCYVGPTTCAARGVPDRFWQR